MTKQEKVAAWLTSLGCTQESTANGYWHHPEVGYIAPAQATFFYQVMVEARIDELALFAQKFIKEQSIGSTPSDLISPEPYIEADDDYEIIGYVDDRIRHLKQEGQSDE